MGYDQAINHVPQFVETFINHAIESDIALRLELTQRLLLNTLAVIDNYGLKLSENCLQKLFDFVRSQFKRVLFDLSDEKFNDNIALWKLTFQLCDSEQLLHDWMNSYSQHLSPLFKNSHQDDAHDLFVESRLYTVIHTFSDIIEKRQNRNEIGADLGYALYVLVSRGIRSEPKTSLANALSSLRILSNVPLRNGKTVIQSILSDINELMCKNDDFSETFIVTISFIIDNYIETDSVHSYLNTENFWATLRKCYDFAADLRKYVFHVLKYAIFVSRPNWIDEKLQTWWTTYFLVLETFNEKQTHLIQPIFPIIEELIVGIDSFDGVDLHSYIYPWAIALLRKGTAHDSRTVRMRTIFSILDAKMDDFVFQMLIETLNDAELFRKILVSNEFDNFTKKFSDWFDSKAQRNDDALFVFITGVDWSPIQLYYTLVLCARLRSKFQQPFSETNAKNVTKLIHNVTRFHSVVIRSAIQSLLIKLVTEHSECSVQVLSSFFAFLDCFNVDECLTRAGREWRYVVAWLRSVGVAAAESFIMSEIHRHIERDDLVSDKRVSSICRNLLMLDDAFDIFNRSAVIRNYIEQTTDSFGSASTNPYLFSKIQDNRLRLVCGVRERAKMIENIADADLTLRNYIFRRLFAEDDLKCVDWLLSCLSKLDDFWPRDAQDDPMTALLSIENDVCGVGVKTRGYWKMISYVYESMSSSTTRRNNFVHINALVLESIRAMIDAGKVKNEMENRPSDLTNTFWRLLELFFATNKTEAPRLIELRSFFTVVSDALDVARDENLPSIFACLRVFFAFEEALANEENAKYVIASSWKRLRDARTTQYYASCVEFWAKAFLQRSFIESSTYRRLITSYVRIMLEDVAEDGGPAYAYVELLLDELRSVENIFDIYEELPHLLVDIFCLTHINRKDQLIEWQTVEHIVSLNEEISANQVEKYCRQHSTAVIRAKAFNIMLQIQNAKNIINVVSKFVKILTKAENSRCKRYFNDSVFHRIKHKKLQLLLIFETILSRETRNTETSFLAETIYNHVVDSLMVEPHQPSVRYLLEWILVRLIIHFPDSFESPFWHSFSQASEERIGSVCSFISVAFHLCKIFNRSEINDRAVKSILPWTMGQHFNARLYAQTVLSKIIASDSELKTTKYEIVENSLKCCLKRGNSVKNAIKLQEDFYFSVFHAERDFSLKTILWDLPRLSSISSEEWISNEVIEKYVDSVECTRFGIPFRNCGEDLSTVESSSWIAKYVQKVADDRNSDEAANVSSKDIQKKFIPLENISDRAKQSTDLIIAASLIDRAANLGGLTRTSEIFAVSALIVDNLSVIRSKEFASLSITAEKHVPIIEVNRRDLFEYLKKLKEEGYCIVAAEQTSNSVKLNDYAFPTKCVIVLGNEKEGIPASLLPIVDVCVEVPQKGVVRSLNVHVSGSLLIWEYTKQHFTHL